MKAAIRCNALSLAALKAQEKHGKRLDKSSRSRRINNLDPIVGGSLDLEDRLNEHTRDTRKNAAAKNVALHFIVRFPPEILTDDAPTPYQGKSKEDRLRLMARQAAKFINEAHGGDAVFAVRVDRDEAGETIADVFACPKYTKTTKKAETTWTSLTKFGKELAVKHQAEVLRRSKDYEGKGPITSPRAIGMSLQSEFSAFFERENAQKLTAKVEKDRPGRDRLDVEDWKLKKVQRDHLEAQQLAEAAEADRATAADEAAHIRTTVKAEKDEFRRQARTWFDREKTAIRTVRENANRDREKAAAELLTARALLNRLKETYTAVRGSLPRIRQILTRDISTADEKRRAKEDRRQAVKISPILRNAIRDAQAIEGASRAAEKTPPDADIPDGLSI